MFFNIVPKSKYAIEPLEQGSQHVDHDLFGGQMTFTQGLPKTIGKTDIRISDSSKFTVMK